MYCLLSDILDPYFNLASEEYFLKNHSADFLLLYRNRPSVIVGKHQNTLAEINRKFVLKHNIQVARRLSGGGTVYHDEGNLNFSFILQGEQGKMVDFQKYTLPVLNALKQIGLNVSLGNRNAILIGDLKISGNAEHIYKSRVLHHGTLLFSSSLENLEGALQVQEGWYRDRAVKSVRSQVTNILDHLDYTMDMHEFSQRIFHYILENHHGSKPYIIPEKDLEEINQLVENKYSTWDWIFGYSPNYQLSREIEYRGQHMQMEMSVEKGRIQQLEFRSDPSFTGILRQIATVLTGLPHREEDLRRALQDALPRDVEAEILFTHFDELFF